MAVVQDPLIAGVAVNGGHQTPVEAEVLIQNLDDRCQAVGGAAGVAEDVPVFVAVLVVVDAHNEGADAITLTRGGEDHLLGASLNVHAGLLIGVEHTGGLDHQVNAPLLPGAVEGIAVSEELDLLTVDEHRAVRGLDVHGGIETPKDGVVGQQVSAGGGVGRGVHPHDFQAGVSTPADPSPQNIATDPAESIDRNAQGHGRSGKAAQGFWPPIIQKSAEIPCSTPLQSARSGPQHGRQAAAADLSFFRLKPSVAAPARPSDTSPLHRCRRNWHVGLGPDSR